MTVSMTSMDWIAVVALAVLSVAQGLRATMLKPSFDAWFSAPVAVWITLSAASIFTAAMALAIFRRGHAEAHLLTVVVIVQAVLGVVMLINLYRQAPPAPDRSPPPAA